MNTNGSADTRLFSGLLGEIESLQSALQTLEKQSVSLDEAVHLVSGIQRDIVQLYRAAQ